MQAPQPLFPFRHSVPLQVRFNDIDIQGHVNNCVYSEYVDQGKMEYFRTVFGPEFTINDIEWVIAHNEFDYYQPVRLGQNLHVQTQVQYVTEKTLHIEHRVVKSYTDEVVCICHCILVSFNLKTGKSQPINPEHVKAIEAFEGRDLTVIPTQTQQ